MGFNEVNYDCITTTFTCMGIIIFNLVDRKVTKEIEFCQSNDAGTLMSGRTFTVNILNEVSLPLCKCMKHC